MLEAHLFRKIRFSLARILLCVSVSLYQLETLLVHEGVVSFLITFYESPFVEVERVEIENAEPNISELNVHRPLLNVKLKKCAISSNF